MLDSILKYGLELWAYGWKKRIHMYRELLSLENVNSCQYRLIDGVVKCCKDRFEEISSLEEEIAFLFASPVLVLEIRILFWFGLWTSVCVVVLIGF